MSTQGYRCIGGPKDGELMACPPGLTSFEVMVPSRPMVRACYGAPPKDLTYTRQVYRLEHSDATDGGLAWVFKG